MKFAFIIMGEFDYGNDRAAIHDGMAQMIGVSSVEEACEAAKILADEGVGWCPQSDRGFRRSDPGGVCHPSAGAG